MTGVRRSYFSSAATPPLLTPPHVSHPPALKSLYRSPHVYAADGSSSSSTSSMYACVCVYAKRTGPPDDTPTPALLALASRRDVNNIRIRAETERTTSRPVNRAPLGGLGFYN